MSERFHVCRGWSLQLCPVYWTDGLDRRTGQTDWTDSPTRPFTVAIHPWSAVLSLASLCQWTVGWTSMSCHGWSFSLSLGLVLSVVLWFRRQLVQIFCSALLPVSLGPCHLVHHATIPCLWSQNLYLWCWWCPDFISVVLVLFWHFSIFSVVLLYLIVCVSPRVTETNVIYYQPAVPCFVLLYYVWRCSGVGSVIVMFWCR